MPVEIFGPPTAATGEPRYHISKKGNPALCRATIKKGCPLGAISPHFRTKEDAGKYVQETEAAIHGNHLTGAKRKPRQVPFTFERLKQELAASPRGQQDPPRGSKPSPLEDRQMKQQVEAAFRQAQGDKPFMAEGSLCLQGYGGVIRGTYQDTEGRETFVYGAMATEGAPGFIFMGDDPEGPEDEAAEAPLIPRFVQTELPPGTTVTAQVVEGLAEDLFRKEGHWEEDLPAVQAAYLRFSHDRLNEGLRAGTLSLPLQATLKKMATQHKLDEPLVVYRGYRKMDEAFVATVNGGRYEDKGMLSTTVEPFVALGFAGCREGSVVLRIELPAGTACFDGRESGEGEILLPPDVDLSKAQALRLTKAEAEEVKRLRYGT